MQSEVRKGKRVILWYPWYDPCTKALSLILLNLQPQIFFLSCICKVLLVLCFTWPRWELRVFRSWRIKWEACHTHLVINLTYFLTLKGKLACNSHTIFFCLNVTSGLGLQHSVRQISFFSESTGNFNMYQLFSGFLGEHKSRDPEPSQDPFWQLFCPKMPSLHRMKKEILI